MPLRTLFGRIIMPYQQEHRHGQISEISIEGCQRISSTEKCMGSYARTTDDQDRVHAQMASGESRTPQSTSARVSTEKQAQTYREESKLRFAKEIRHNHAAKVGNDRKPIEKMSDMHQRSCRFASNTCGPLPQNKSNSWDFMRFLQYPSWVV